MAQTFKSKDSASPVAANQANQAGNDGVDKRTIPEVGSVLEQRKQRQEAGDLPHTDSNDQVVEEEGEAEGEDYDASKPKSRKFLSRIKEKVIKLKNTLKEEIVGAPEAASFRDYVKDPAKEAKNVPDTGVDAAAASGATPGEFVPGDATPVAGVQSGKSIPEEKVGQKEVLGKDFDFEPVNEAVVTGENEKAFADQAKNEYFAKHPEQARRLDVNTESAFGGPRVVAPHTPNQGEAATSNHETPNVQLTSKLSPEELRRMDEGLLAMYQKAGLTMPEKGPNLKRGNETETGTETGMSKTDADIGKASAYTEHGTGRGDDLGSVPKATAARQEVPRTAGPTDNVGNVANASAPTAEGFQVMSRKDGGDVGGQERAMVDDRLPSKKMEDNVFVPSKQVDSGVLGEAGVVRDKEHVTGSGGKKDHPGGILEVIAESLGLVKHDASTTTSDAQQVPK